MSYMRYKINPVDSHKTLVNEYKARGASALSFVLSICTIACLAFFTSVTIEVFKKLSYHSFFKASIFLLVMVLLDGLVAVFLSYNRKSTLLNLCLYLLLSFSLLMLILGSAQLYHNVYFGFLTIIASVLLIITFILLKIIKYRKDNGMNTHLFKDSVDINVKME